MRALAGILAALSLTAMASPPAEDGGGEGESRALPNGVWAGELQLCDGTVASARRSMDEYAGYPLLAVTLTDAAAVYFAELTGQRIGRTLPIRLDDTVLTEPVVREPIMSGSFTITGMDEATLERVRAAMLAPCRTG